MSFTRTQPDGVWLGAGYVPPTTDWDHLRTKVFQGVNGVRGGAWNPTDPIDFPTGKLTIAGPLLVAYGGSLRMSYRLGGASPWPEFAPGHALRETSIVTPLIDRRSTPQSDWLLDRATVSPQSAALGIQPSDRSRLLSPARARVALDVQDTGRLIRATFSFTVPLKRSAAPFAMPRFRLVRVDVDGRPAPLASAAVGADAEGWQSPAKVTSAEAWFNAGLAQSFTYRCDQNHVVDVSKYQYFVEWFEEGVEPRPVTPALIDGSTIREQKFDVVLATDGPIAAAALTGLILIDGSNVATGMRVLVKNGFNGDESGTRYINGIWIANTGGAWTRAKDFDEVADISRGCFVNVLGGTANRGSTWQIATPLPTAIDNASSLGRTADVYFEHFAPTGNKYHAVTCDFDEITHLRWQ